MIRRILRIVVLVVILSVFISLGIIWFQTRSGETEQEVLDDVVDETFVTRGGIDVTVTSTGTIAPSRQVPLIFELSAPVAEIMIAVGDQVEEGQVLARLDSQDFEVSVEDAQLAYDFQKLAFDALSGPPREVDIAVAEASLAAARAAYNAAASTAPTDNQVEVARLQTELAKNQFWQTQLQADPIIEQGELVFPPDFPPEVEDLIRDTVDELNAQNRSQYDVALTQLEYGVDIAEANYDATQARGPDYGAVNSAYASRVQSQIALEQLLEGPEQAQFELATIDLQQAELALIQAQNLLANTELRAPFDGVIVENNLVVDQLPPQSAALVLMDLSDYFVELLIDETDIVSVQEGLDVELFLDALPDAGLTGRVVQVAQTPTQIGQLISYRVRVKLDPTEAPVRVGMTATARIITRQLDDILILRNRFIRIDRVTRTAYVTVQGENGRYEEVEITLGTRNETFSEVVDGLREGQRVVLLPRVTDFFGGG